MRRKSVFIVALILLTVYSAVMLTSCEKKQENVLTVYAYDSFADSWGPGNELVDMFEKKTGLQVNLVRCGAAVEMYSRILFEGNNTPADVVIGLSDNMDIDRTLFDSLEEFDYGYYCFLYNEDEIEDVPTSFEQIIKPEYKGKYILIDPRTSSVGLGLLKWTVLAMGEEKAMQWWKTAIKNSLTVCDSWSSAYGLFTENEAPMVVSYTTSPAYHIINEGKYNIKPVEFEEGHIKTDELIGILKSSDMKKQAKEFFNFILSEGQEKIAVSNTMFPANSEILSSENSNLKALSDCLVPAHILDSSKYEGSAQNLVEKWILNTAD